MARSQRSNSGPNLPSDSEWAILDVLWRIGPSTAPRVAAELESTRGWAYSTVKTLLDRMATKSIVTAQRIGNVWLYEAAIEPATARQSAWRAFIGSAFGGATAPALEFIAYNARLTRRQREMLRNLLEQSTEETP